MTKPPRGRQPVSDGVRWDERGEEPLLGEVEDTAPFNPLDTKNLAVAVTKALLEKKARSLGGLSSFREAGIYRCKPRPETEADIRREILTYLEGAAVPSLAALGGDLIGK